MKATEWVAVVAIVVGAGSLAYWIFIVIIDALGTAINQWRFRRAFRKAILHSQPSWTQVCDIALDYGMSKHVAYGAAREFLREILVGSDEKRELDTHSQLIESYVQAFKDDEPFDGIHDDTRLTLEKLRKDLGPNAGVLMPLANHLRELTRINDVSNRRQRFYTFGGFVVGVLGLVYGVLVSVYPLGQSVGGNPAATPPGQAESK